MKAKPPQWSKCSSIKKIQLELSIDNCINLCNYNEYEPHLGIFTHITLFSVKCDTLIT